MSFESRSFSGKLFRPKPEIYAETNYLTIVATPWGPRSSAKKVIQTIVDYFLSTKDDLETTAPFEKLSCLSTTANNLRIACMLANEAVYREENKNEYLSGVEIFAGSHLDQEYVCVQLGQPQIFLRRKHRATIPIGASLDQSLDMTIGKQLLPPLPNQMLGLDPTLNVTVSSFRPQKGDQLIVASRSTIPSEFFKKAEAKIELDDLCQTLSSDDPDCPFWVGTINF